MSADNLYLLLGPDWGLIVLCAVVAGCIGGLLIAAVFGDL